jgi:hypothetical protein
MAPQDSPGVVLVVVQTEKKKIVDLWFSILFSSYMLYS